MNAISVSQIWKEHNQIMENFIRKRVRNRQDAEDILQEAFLRIHISIKNLKDTTRIKAWVYRIVRNTISDYYRRKINRDETQSLNEDLAVSSSEEYFFNTEIYSCLNKIIPGLPRKYKQALIETQLENKSYKKFGEESELSLTGAKSRVQRAKSLLRRSLLSCCHINTDHQGNVVDYSLKGKSCTFC